MSRKRLVFSVFPLFLTFLLAGAGQVLADEVILENGDRLSGTVLKAEGGKLTLKTEYAGEIQIPLEKIRKISTENPVEVHLSSGEVVKGRLKTVEEGKLGVEPSPERAAANIPWDKVASINPPPKKPAKLTGSITAGGSIQSGNTERRTASLGVLGSIRGERDRFGLRFLFNYSDEKGEVTARNFYGGLKYDYFFTQRFYGYLALEMLQDRFKNLNLRTIVGPGVGYQVWEEPEKSLLLEAGVAYFSEDRREGPDDSWVTGRLAWNFQYKLFNLVTFSDQFELYPNFNNFGEYTWRNEAALTSPLGANWALRLANIWERDSNPSPGIKKDDFLTTLGLQYSF